MKTRYLKTGEKVLLIETLKSGQFLIENLMEDCEGGEYDSGYLQIVDQIFDRQPKAVYDKDVKALQQKIKDLHTELGTIRKEVSGFEKDEKSRLRRLKRHESLKLLEDYLDGKITHYVTLGYRPEIVKFEDEKDSYDHSGLKLLSLFGNSKGDLTWRLNDYNDGSGSWKSVFPCTSYEGAQQKLQEYMDLGITKEKTPSKSNILLAKEYELILPDGYTEKVQKQQADNIDKQIKEHEITIKELKEKRVKWKNI